MKKKLLVFLAAAMVLAPLSVKASYNVPSAQDYLLAHAENPWSTMALTVLNANPVPTDYLKTTDATSAIGYVAPILALTARGLDPKTFGQKDYIAELKKYHTAGQIGDPGTLNDDIFGLLALISAGEQSSDSAVSDAKNFILSHQQSNGGWGFATSGGTDSNMTAAAVVALIAVGIPSSDTKIQNALAYLKTAQNSDGGFTYDPQSSFGTDSDSSSTAWVIWAINAVGQNITDWSKSGQTPTGYLESNQTNTGYFKYQSSSSEDAFSAVTTAYAVIALAGKTLPLKIAFQVSKFPFRIEGKSNTVCAGEAEGPTALDIVKNASQICGFTYHIAATSFGPYLDRISDDAAAGLIGWIYLVNFSAPSVGAADYVLKPGDSVLWFYGDYNWKPSRLLLSGTEINSGQSSTATVEYFDSNSWIALTDAQVKFGTDQIVTNGSGQASVTAADGFYQVFAEKDGFIRSNSVLLKIGNPSSTQVSLQLNVVKGQVKGSTISFTVDPSSLDFGNLSAGQSNSKTLTVTNTGTTNITMEDAVSGDDIFISNLKLDNASWQSFHKNVATSQVENVNAGITVPVNYAGGEGSKKGSITFWAVAQ